MLYIALIDSFIIGLLLGLFELRQRRHESVHRETEERFAVERSELLTRIAHPQYIPPTREELPKPERAYTDMDEFERVGRIEFGAPEDHQ